MRKKNIIRLLRNMSEESTEQIAKEYPGLTDSEKNELRKRIERQLSAVQPEQETIVKTEQTSVAKSFSLWGLFQRTAAAACVLVLCGTFAGLFWMRSRIELPEQPKPTGSVNREIGRIYSVGESCAAVNLTKSGILWLTVTGTEYDGEYCHVRITLESSNAVSIAGDSIFMLDNLMAATGRQGNNWNAVQPCRVTLPGEQDSLPYSVSLRPDEKKELELWYRFREKPSDIMFVTSYSSDFSYIAIKEN